MKCFLPPTRVSGLAALATAGVVSLLSTSPAQAQLAADPAMKFDLKTFVNAGVIAKPTDVAFLPDGRVIILQKDGDIAVRTAGGVLIPNAGRPPGTIDTASEKGLLGIVPHPNFGQNRTLFMYVSNGPDADTDKHRVLAATISDDNKFTFAATPIVTGGLQGPKNHDGSGMVIFNNQLYLSVGDTGENKTPPVNKYGTCLNRANGKILRVNLDGSIPADNPLTGVAMVTACDVANRTTGDFTMAPPDKRIFAWGLRNAFRFWIDPMTARMWLGEVGEGAREQIEVSEPVDKAWKGQHFGWPFEEGTISYAGNTTLALKTCMAVTPATACTPPAFEYPHQGMGGDNCIIGGLIPSDGCGWPDDYKNKYFFGDHGSSKIYTVDVKPDRSGVVPGSRKDFATVGGMSSFRMGHNAGLYVTIENRGVVVVIQPKNLPAACMGTNAAPGIDAGVDAPRAQDASTAADAPRGGASGAPGSAGSSGGAGASGSGGRTGGGAGSPAPGAGGGGGNTADPGGAGGNTAPTPMAKEAGGCGCHTAGDASSGGGLTLTFVLGVCLRARRRRRVRA